MGFGWTSVTKGETKAKKQHVNEIKEATDSLADDLTISHYSWSFMPVESGDKILYGQLAELRGALDYISDNNSCNTFNTGVDTNENGTDHTTDNSTNDYNEDGTYYSGRLDNYHATDCLARCTSNKSSLCLSYGP